MIRTHLLTAINIEDNIWEITKVVLYVFFLYIPVSVLIDLISNSSSYLAIPGWESILVFIILLALEYVMVILGIIYFLHLISLPLIGRSVSIIQNIYNLITTKTIIKKIRKRKNKTHWKKNIHVIKYLINNHPLLFLYIRNYLLGIYSWIVIVVGIYWGVRHEWYFILEFMDRDYGTLNEIIHGFYSLKVIKGITLMTFTSYFLFVICPPEETVEDIQALGNYLILSLAHIMKHPSLLWVKGKKIKKIIEKTDQYMIFLSLFIFYRFGVSFETLNFGKIMIRIIQSKNHFLIGNIAYLLKEINLCLENNNYLGLMRSIDLLTGTFIQFNQSVFNNISDAFLVSKKDSEMKKAVIGSITIIIVTLILDIIKKILTIFLLYT